jgi:hypothetical protein
MMDVIAVLLVVVGFAIGWCLRGCHEDEKAVQRIERKLESAPGLAHEVTPAVNGVGGRPAETQHGVSVTPRSRPS